MFQCYFIFSSFPCCKILMIQVRVIYNLSYQYKPKLNLIFQFLPPNVRIDQVSIWLCDSNQELEDSDGKSLDIPLILNLYGIHMRDILVLFTVLDLVLVLKKLSIIELNLTYIGPIIGGTYLLPSHMNLIEKGIYKKENILWFVNYVYVKLLIFSSTLIESKCPSYLPLKRALILSPFTYIGQ